MSTLLVKIVVLLDVLQLLNIVDAFGTKTVSFIFNNGTFLTTEISVLLSMNVMYM
jgi:hypothetical protein